MLTGLRHQGIVLESRAMIGKAGEAIRPGQVVLSYGGVGSDGTREPGHVLHVVSCEVHKETSSIFVF